MAPEASTGLTPPARAMLMRMTPAVAVTPKLVPRAKDIRLESRNAASKNSRGGMSETPSDTKYATVPLTRHSPVRQPMSRSITMTINESPRLPLA